MNFLFFLSYISLVIFLAITIFKKDTFIKKNEKYIVSFVILLGLISIFLRYVLPILKDGYLSFGDFPIHFCRISMILVIFYFLLKQNRKYNVFLFFFSALGFISILSSEGYFFQLNPEVITYPFIVDHTILSLTPIYLLVVNKYYPTKKDLYIMITIFCFTAFIAAPLTTIYNENFFSLQVAQTTFSSTFFDSSLYFTSLMMIILGTFYYIIIFYLSRPYTERQKKTSDKSDNIRL